MQRRETESPRNMVLGIILSHHNSEADTSYLVPCMTDGEWIKEKRSVGDPSENTPPDTTYDPCKFPYYGHGIFQYRAIVADAPAKFLLEQSHLHFL